MLIQLGVHVTTLVAVCINGPREGDKLDFNKWCHLKLPIGCTELPNASLPTQRCV